MKGDLRTILVLAGLLIILPAGLFSQQREISSLNQDWNFIKSDVALPGEVDWQNGEVENIKLPHTWNNMDVYDEIPGYYRGAGWYRKTLKLDKDWEERRVFIEFEAANQLAEVFINGRSAGTHEGGYSGFRFDITDYLKSGESDYELCVRVDNSHNPDIPPLSADFTFFGGIYRDVWLIYAPKTHFSLEHFGAAGVYWQTPLVNHENAELNIFGFLSNQTGKNGKYIIEYILKDSRGKEIAKESFKLSVQPGINQEIKPASILVNTPELWSTKKPNCYSLFSRLIDQKSGEIIDELIQTVGFRWFEFTADQGFFLNGEHLKIHGSSRHQDYPGKGNALDREQHIEDIRGLKEMGGNFLRIAHYPQDPDVIAACDTAGILTSVEIPIVNQITESEKFTENCLIMMKEMIWQNYNHPGLIMWTYMNEVLLRPPYTDDPDRQEVYYNSVNQLARKLEQTARSLDPFRATMIPNHGAMSKYMDVGLTDIPMVVGWNLYQGWYGANFDGFGKFLDDHHAKLPGKPVIVTEYGAGHDPRLISNDPERFDFTAEFAMIYHKKYVEEMEKRDFVSGGLIWILNDFSSEGRGDAVPHINSKGVRGLDRVPKETYWFYKSIWSKEPFVKIWTPFPGILISSGSPSVKIYTNAGQVQLILNGSDMGLFRTSSGLIEASLPLNRGINQLVAKIPGSEIKDVLSFNFLGNPGEPDSLTKGVDLHISCGDHRYIWDDAEKVLWLPDQPYNPGSWGHIGGNPYKEKTRHGVKPSSEKQITGTSLDPVFQTRQNAPEEYRFDIPPGSYEVSLLFSELSSAEEFENLAYNLGDNAIAQDFPEREFSVEINGELVLKSINLLKSDGAFRKVEKTIKIDILEAGGLKIKFLKELGDPVISGIVIKEVGI